VNMNRCINCKRLRKCYGFGAGLEIPRSQYPGVYDETSCEHFEVGKLRENLIPKLDKILGLGYLYD
jgi:hypothetical protein